MSSRSLRSGIIKTGDSIQRATRQNTILYKTETGFQQARQVDKRYTLNLMPVCSLKRKRKESPIDKSELTNVKKQHTTQLKQNEKISHVVDKHQKEDVPIKQPVNEISNTLRSVDTSWKEMDNSTKRQPRMASLNAIAKVNAVLDNYIRYEKKYVPHDSVFEGLNTVTVPVVCLKKETYLNEGKACSSHRLNEEMPSFSCRLSEENAGSSHHRLSGPRVEVRNSKADVKLGAKVEVSKTIENDNCASKEKDTLSMDDVNVKVSKSTGKAIDTMKDMKHLKIKPLNEELTEIDRSNNVKEAEGEEVPKVAKCSSKIATYSVNEVNVNFIVQTICPNKTPIASHLSEQETCSSNQCKDKVDSKIEVVILTCNDNFSEISDSESVPYEMYSPESGKELDDDNVNKEIEMSDQAVQTDINDKSIQTDVKHLPNLNNKQLCTCKIKSESTPAISLYSPMNQEYLPKPFYVKSTVLAHTNNHTLVVPIKKRHVLKEKENEYAKPSMTRNISALLDTCINNTFLQNNITCSKLVYLANYKEKSVILNTPNIHWKKDNSKSTKPVDNSHLQVPQVYFGSLSNPDSKSNGIDKNNSKGTSVVSTKKKIRSPLGRRKKCNGWQFEGDPMEESYTLGTQVITRRHYQTLCRNNEVLRIHDAVILKSGLGKGDADYLARISMFWEDLSGPHAGDMMMSIYWYYKPEQTNFKLPETSKMEVYASRHRDDNSVACIVDKCYVISITQFCRFQAQKMLLKEKRKKKLKVVPENKNVRSRFLPSPDVDESIVYFCRYGYEYRCGKLIKGL